MVGRPSPMDVVHFNVGSVTQSSVKKAPQAENFQILHWFSKMISDFLSFPNHNGFYTTFDFYTTLSCMCPSASEFPPSTIKSSACYLTGNNENSAAEAGILSIDKLIFI